MDCIGRSAGLRETRGPRYLYRRRSICVCLPAHAQSVREERVSGTVFPDSVQEAMPSHVSKEVDCDQGYS